MRHSVWIFIAALSGCGQLGLTGLSGAPPSDQVTETQPEVAAPAALARPAADARMAEDFDTTSEADRARATASDTSGTAQALGATVASLGNPADPGFWLETPLVTEEASGRIVHAGQSVAVTLRPADGPATAGSRLSLPAMRVLGVPLTALLELEVFRR